MRFYVMVESNRNSNGHCMCSWLLT